MAVTRPASCTRDVCQEDAPRVICPPRPANDAVEENLAEAALEECPRAVADSLLDGADPRRRDVAADEGRHLPYIVGHAQRISVCTHM